MSRLLVLTYHFPPDGSVGGQRWAGLSKYLARMGWEVHVITAAPPGDEKPVPGVRRHVELRRKTLDDRYKARVRRRLKERSAGGGAAASTPSPASTPSRSPLSWAFTAVRRIASTALVFPDAARGWVSRAAPAARTLLRAQKFDIVVSSGPPNLAHFAAMIAMRGMRIPHVIDMRDPWSSAHERHSPMEDYFIVRGERVVITWLERVMFRHADKIIVNTREFTARFKASRPDLDIQWFPNGVDLEPLPRRDPGAIRPGSLSYAGALYAGRNLSTVFAAMRAVIDERPEAADFLRVDIAGGMDPPHRELMNSQLAAAGLTSLVTIHGVVPRSEAIRLLNQSHVALVLAQNQGMAVPAKIYECVGLGVPTLVVAEEGSASRNEANRIGAMTVDGDDVEGMRKVLLDMLDGRIPLRRDPITPIAYPDLAVQMDRLLRDVIAR